MLTSPVMLCPLARFDQNPLASSIAANHALTGCSQRHQCSPFSVFAVFGLDCFRRGIELITLDLVLAVYHSLSFRQVMNDQRLALYRARDDVIKKEQDGLRELVLEYSAKTCTEIVQG